MGTHKYQQQVVQLRFHPTRQWLVHTKTMVSFADFMRERAPEVLPQHLPRSPWHASTALYFWVDSTLASHHFSCKVTVSKHVSKLCEKISKFV